jgi:hypothetical protein
MQTFRMHPGARTNARADNPTARRRLHALLNRRLTKVEDSSLQTGHIPLATALSASHMQRRQMLTLLGGKLIFASAKVQQTTLPSEIDDSAPAELGLDKSPRRNTNFHTSKGESR